VLTIGGLSVVENGDSHLFAKTNSEAKC
jgi:hypothetical protein